MKAICDVCGEDDRRLHRLVVRMDGKVVARWTLCRSCAAIKRVLIGTEAKHWPKH